MMRRTLAMLRARNLEFLRDRSALSWNIILPILLVFGLGFMFSSGEKPIFKVAVLSNTGELTPRLHPFLATRYIDFFAAEDREQAIRKVSRHRIDMLLDLRPQERRYWINTTSPKGYLVEHLLAGSGERALRRETIEEEQIRYVDWLVPGILGMNMMFSGLFGVGYVIVRYRKNGYLKRLNATPLSAIEFLIAQVGSRLLLIMTISVLVFMGTDYFIQFPMEGRYIDLFILAVLGAICMISLGLTVAARVSSEEMAGGLLNLLSWPMMIMSGVWFSMEGTHPILQRTAELFPLTHLLAGARAIMLDGANLINIAPDLIVLGLMSTLFLAVGAGLFKWHQD